MSVPPHGRTHGIASQELVGALKGAVVDGDGEAVALDVEGKIAAHDRKADESDGGGCHGKYREERRPILAHSAGDAATLAELSPKTMSASRPSAAEARRARRRAAREERQRAARMMRRLRLAGMTVLGAGVVAALAVLVIALGRGPEADAPERIRIANEGRQHVAEGSVVEYGANPPSVR